MLGTSISPTLIAVTVLGPSTTATFSGKKYENKLFKLHNT